MFFFSAIGVVDGKISYIAPSVAKPKKDGAGFFYYVWGGYGKKL